MTRPNFNIIEGVYDNIDFEEFKKDYMDWTMSKKDIMEKYGLTHNRYCRYGRDVFRETGFKRNAGVTPRNIYSNIRESGSNSYRIDKQMNGENKYCGSYPTLSKAIRVRNYLIEHDWSNEAIKHCMSGGDV